MENDIQLSPHFKLSEFTKSDTATQMGIDNTPSADVIDNLRNLCEKVLEPLRIAIGVPINISSGYRCPKLNKVVGGVSNSQHLIGEAADIFIPKYTHKSDDSKLHSNMDVLKKWMLWIIDNTDFDQCIKETADRRTYWIHVSCKRDATLNRRHVISFLLKSR